ncbi:MAG: hypothetical protein DRH10_10380 [Deltaproteobacteria bacterium]|nr:MAG: hypothetical protein DRH10_10380 [Deltaproteobacteria bacterium]
MKNKFLKIFSILLIGLALTKKMLLPLLVEKEIIKEAPKFVNSATDWHIFFLSVAVAVVIALFLSEPKQTRKNVGGIVMILLIISGGYFGIKNLANKDNKETTTYLIRPGQVIWSETLRPNKVYDTKIELTVGSGVFIKNNGPGRVKGFWAEFDTVLEPGEQAAFNFVKYRPGATIKFQVLEGDSANVVVKS